MVSFVLYYHYYAFQYVLISASMHIANICGSMTSFHTSQSHDTNKSFTLNVKQ